MIAAYGCVDTRALAPELALEIVGGAERAEAVEHLGSCSGCRAYLAELTDVVDALPVLVTEADPPAGFEGRVLERLRADRPAWRRRTGRVVVALLAALAVAAAASIVSVAVVRIAEGTSARSASKVAEGALVDRRGEPVGTVLVSAGSRRALFASIDPSLPRGHYVVEGRGGGHTWTRLHAFDKGAAAVELAVAVPGAAWPVRAVRLIDGSGAPVAGATVTSATGS